MSLLKKLFCKGVLYGKTVKNKSPHEVKHGGFQYSNRQWIVKA